MVVIFHTKRASENSFRQGGLMKRNRLYFRPTKNSDLTFETLYDEISRDRRQKAEALQVRRWRALKREMRGGL
jgi:hypothetical protein